ncbi:MAG: HIT family protein [Candidatus Woesearchaeota archaeon]|nr:HIT family protein [Candidatus Woesearchaeota archaeon]
MDCLFCKIVAGEIPCMKVDESEHFLAFLDIAPVQQGHTLVIPKEHSESFDDFSTEHATEFLEFTQKVSKHVVKQVGAAGCNVGINNGEAAGQIIFHTHFHVIPRRERDGLESWHGTACSQGELKKVHEKLRQ